jgi:cytochrome c oxidase cbb3-type subunit 3
MRKSFNINLPMRFLLMILLMTGPLLAKAESTAPVSQPFDFMSLFIIIVLGIIILALLFLLYTLKVLFDHTNPSEVKEPVFAGIIRKLTDTVPVEQEDVILTDHIYDGIQELDNNLPPWWKYMFYATIVFAGVYIYFYHFNENGKLQAQEYEQEMNVAEKEKIEYMKLAANSIDETNVKVADAKGIENGKSLFLSNCAACHGRAGEGGVGPNLTDEYWLHGGGIKNVFKSVKYGIPQNGMISWKSQLSPKNIQEVASYILSIKGTNPANGKAPQGDKYEEKEEIASK